MEIIIVWKKKILILLVKKINNKYDEKDDENDNENEKSKNE